MLAWLIFISFTCAGHGTGTAKARAYAVELAKWDAAGDAMVFCHARGGDTVSEVLYTVPECVQNGALFYCSINATGECSKMNP